MLLQNQAIKCSVVLENRTTAWRQVLDLPIRQLRLTLTLSGRLGAWGGEAERKCRPVHSKGLLAFITKVRGIFIALANIANVAESLKVLQAVKPPARARNDVINMENYSIMWIPATRNTFPIISLKNLPADCGHYANLLLGSKRGYFG